MKRIAFSIVTILFAGGVIASGATGAFLSDTETSTGNTFTAGTIDLKIDNESYATDVNGVFTLSTTTSWGPSDLGNGLLFFNFQDLKPSDKGEDTISLHVDNNDSYACIDVSLTSNDDKSSNDPELGDGDAQEDINNTWDGELAQNINMFWWADDGDNVYEVGENSISGGVKSLFNLASSSGPFSVTLADSQFNAWGSPGPIPGGVTRYIGKAWCFGTMGLTPVAQDNLGHQLNAANGPLIRGMGVSCNGSNLNNITQTDSATVDVAFRAIQSRNNQSFTCGDTQPRVATVRVIKIVNNIHGGNNAVSDYQLFVDNGISSIPVTSNIATQVSPGTYTIGETGVSGYVATFSGDCDANGELTLAAGDNKQCTITNTDQEAHITLIKSVINNNGGTATPSSSWGLKIDGANVPNNSSVTVTSNTAHTINETGRAGYHFVSISGHIKCPAVLGGTATLDEGESITCTITNDDN